MTPVNLDRVSELVATIGSQAFNAEYFRLFKDAIDIHHCTVFAFRGNDSPQAIVTESSEEASSAISMQLAREYCAGGYRNDPNVQTEALDSKPVVYALRALDVGDLNYRRRYYVDPSIDHELVILGRMNDALFYASFYRTGKTQSFHEQEVIAARALASFAIRALNRHSELSPPARSTPPAPRPVIDTLSPDARQKSFEHLRDALLAESHKLSPREAEVCACIVLGYTTLGISLKLGISLNTVATHRKRAYMKLGISSQNELFAQYFRNAARFNLQPTT